MCPSADDAPAIPQDKLRLLFALLFSSPEPVTQDRIRSVLYGEGGDGEGGDGEGGDDAEEQRSPREHLEALEEWMRARDLPLTLHRVGRAWRLLTSADLAEALETARRQSRSETVGPAALEVLALVAYRQPVLKADVDAIRGVKSGPHLRHLLDLRMVRILGRAELPGRPFLYGTTREFLDRFGLQDLDDLPEAGRLAAPAEPGVRTVGEEGAPGEERGSDGGEEAQTAAAEGGAGGAAGAEPQ